MKKLPEIVHGEVNAKADVTKIVDKTLTAVSPIIESFCRLIDSPRKGIETLCEAFFKPYIERQKVKGLLTQAQGEKDCEDIRAGKKEFRKNILQNIEIEKASQTPSFTDVISNEDTKRLCLAIIAAMEEIERDQDSDNKYSDEPIDETFFNHWRKEAELISEEELRKWWAHLLVAETKKSHSISIRTLNVARSITKEEAQLFVTICKGVFQGRNLICKDNSPLFGTYEDILTLSDAGLIIPKQSQFSKDNQISVENCKVTLSYLDNSLIAVSNVEIKNIHICVYKLTSAGEELFQILKECINKENIIEQIKEISRQNNNISFKLMRASIINGKIYTDKSNFEMIRSI